MKKRFPVVVGLAGAMLAACAVGAPLPPGTHAAPTKVATLSDVDVQGGHAYGGSSTPGDDDNGPEYESLAIRDATVGKYHLVQINAITDHPSNHATPPKYLGHPYSSVSAHCASVVVYKTPRGTMTGIGSHCSITRAVR